MDIEPLIDAARARTGIDEFDSESFREGLEVLVRGFFSRPDVSDEVRARFVDEFGSNLDNRLRVSEYLRQKPELADAPLDAPVIIMGMPRTGTTAISYMLAEDPRWRSLLNWEAVDSVPPPTTATLKTDPRCLERKALQQKIFDAMPVTPVHWEWADGPTECIFVHAQDWKALSWEARCPSAEYSEYILSCDMTSAYDYEKRVLRVLQSQAPGRWALKMPSHSLHIEAVVAAFPDAKLIWTHRDPFKCLASLCTTIASGHQSGLGTVDVEHIRRTLPHQLAEHVRRPMALRDRLPPDQILDVYFPEFIVDPMGEMRRIYGWLGLPLDEALEARMTAWLDTDSKRQATRASYSLEDYGLAREGVAPLFEEYLAAHPRAIAP